MPTPGDHGIPGQEACRALLARYRVPEHIRRHSEQVARVAEALGGALVERAGEGLDLGLLVAGALLHDIAKARCLGSRRDHAREGAELLRRAGYGRVAALVEEHVVLRTFRPEGPVTETEVLNYSDKRVRHDEVVSLDERFEDLIERYGRGHPEAERRIRQTWERARALERKLFARLPFTPQDLPSAMAE